MSKPIYTIVTFNHRSDIYRKDGSSYKWRGQRAVGFYFEQDDAIKIVENNVCDIYEDGYYPYALVETVHEGLYAGFNPKPLESQIWFEWNSEQGKYVKMDKCPEDLKNTFNFSIG